MKFTVATGELQKALAKVSGVVPSKSTLPILENILFTLTQNELRLAATDLEVSISASMTVKGAEDGTIAVPAKRVMDTIRALPDVQLVFHADHSSHKVRMITESGEYNLVGESSEEFPTTPQFKSENEVTLNAHLLGAIIARTLFSVSTDELRPSMTGILLQFKENELRAVATDGHRLVRITHKEIKGGKAGKDVIVPSKALGLVGRTLEEGTCGLSVSGTHVQFTTGKVTLTSRLIEEAYPNYESVIPLDNEKKLRVSRDILLASVRRVALYSSSTTHQVRFSLKKDELRVTAEDVDFGGEAREKIVCQYAADEMEIGFNSTYVVDILSHIDSSEIVFKFSSAVRAAIITPAVTKENEDVLMLVMPMRLNA
jgi:DNA polymerase-3 subunit beta